MEESINISLLDRFMKGETSLEEEAVLLEWFRSTDGQKELSSFYRKRWEEVSDMTLPPEQQEQMFLRLKQQMRDTPSAATNRRFSLTPWLGYAAAILLCIGIVTSYLYKRSAPAAEKEYVVSADKGQRATLTLPDGTKVWLNSHTEISYSNTYGTKERLVSLVGEAYFEVAKDAGSRFIVKAGDMEVEALGTTFNIKAYKEDEDVVATLFSGKVRATAADAAVVLEPNQFAAYNRHTHKLIAQTADNVNYARMWRDNELAFEGETMEEVALVLNRLYNVNICFASEKAKGYRFRGVIKNRSLDNVIELISLTAPITYTSLGDTITIDEKPMQ